MQTLRGAASWLAQLTERGADRFDPARFRYIAALVRRSAEKHAPVRRRLADKALIALDDYQRRYEAARNEAAGHMARIAVTHPDAAERVRRHFDQCHFHGIRRLAKRLDRGRHGGVLAELNDQIARAGRIANQDAAKVSLDALLRQQEEAVVASAGIPADARDAPPSMAEASLRSFRLFEKTWAAHHAETLVTHAITHVPDNPGHLNRQMLVIRCLSAMRRFAPAYLRRWVTSVETLLWLEGAGEDDNTPRIPVASSSKTGLAS